jgi:DNA-binding GntR family transcriptional regulator
MVIRHAGQDMMLTHARIIEALQAGDAAAAREAMLDELIDTRQSVLDFVIRREGATWQLDS